MVKINKSQITVQLNYSYDKIEQFKETTYLYTIIDGYRCLLLHIPVLYENRYYYEFRSTIGFQNISG